MEHLVVLVAMVMQEMTGVAIGPGSVADGTSGTGNGNGNSRSVALDGGHTSQGCTDAIG